MSYRGYRHNGANFYTLWPDGTGRLGEAGTRRNMDDSRRASEATRAGNLARSFIARHGAYGARVRGRGLNNDLVEGWVVGVDHEHPAKVEVITMDFFKDHRYLPLPVQVICDEGYHDKGKCSKCPDYVARQ